MNKSKAVATASERARSAQRGAYLNEHGTIRFPEDYDESCYCHLHSYPSCDAIHCLTPTIHP